MHTNEETKSTSMEGYTCQPKWTGIPVTVQQHTLDFLSPTTVLKIIIGSQTSINTLSSYIIQRLQTEALKYTLIQASSDFTLALSPEPYLYLGG